MSKPPKEDGGPYVGMQPANIPIEIFNACTSSGEFDADVYMRLQTTIDTDGLYDLLEAKSVQDSWKAAFKANASFDK